MVKSVIVKDVFETFSYFYIDEESKHGFLIDPGAEPERLLRIIRQNDWTIEKILLTHGHFDHLGAVEKISQELQIPYLIHRNGEEYLKDTTLNLSSFCNRNIVLENAEYFEDNTKIGLKENDAFYLQVIHTPGHTPDSVIFYNKNEGLAFVGDTIFKGSIGNTGYPGGNARDLRDSIVKCIFLLPKETKLYSGHSDITTVEMEMSRYIR